MEETETQTPLFSVGVIADIQYAPIPNGFSYLGTPRYYRHSLEVTKHAFETFRDYRRPRDTSHKFNDDYGEDEELTGDGEEIGVDLVINLGDIIDGKCQEIENNGGCLLSPTSANRNENDDAVWKDFSDHQGMLSLLEIKHAMKPYEGMSAQYESSHSHNRKILHSYGNHCLYNLNRTELRETLGIPFRIERATDEKGKLLWGFGSYSKRLNESIYQDHKNNIPRGDSDNDNDNDDGDLVGYYSYVHPPHPPSTTNSSPDSSSYTVEPSSPDNNNNSSGIKFIFLDSYDISLMRRSATHSSKRHKAVEILKQENGKNFGEGNENSPEGLEGLQKRFVAFNGAVGLTQLSWLRNELETTRKLNQENNYGAIQKAVIISHQPIHPRSSNPVCLIWNYNHVLEILRDFSDVVIASFAGHAHKGGYCRDEESGIHFRVIEAVLESKPPITTFGILDVYRDRLHLKGYGDCQSAVYWFDGNHSCDGDEDDDDYDESVRCGDPRTEDERHQSNVCALSDRN